MSQEGVQKFFYSMLRYIAAFIKIRGGFSIYEFSSRSTSETLIIYLYHISNMGNTFYSDLKIPPECRKYRNQKRMKCCC